jgi:hypothetical protein
MFLIGFINFLKVELSEEEKSKKSLRDKIKKEYLAALKKEGIILTK